MSQKEDGKPKEDDELDTLIKYVNDKDDNKLISDIINRENSRVAQSIQNIPEEPQQGGNKKKGWLMRKAGSAKN